jgi:hypothetical protein
VFSLSLLGLVLALPQPLWQSDYEVARKHALRDQKDMFIYFSADDRLDAVLKQPEVRERLSRFVCLRVPADYRYGSKRLLEYSALEDMVGQPGLAVVSLHDPKLPQHNEVISAHPFVGSHYGWAPAYGENEVKLILDLPPRATLTQRSMIYAVTVHPERPQSIRGLGHFAFLGHAERHSQRQAAMRHQHHANLIASLGTISSEAGEYLGNGSEVVAESWGNFVGGETVLEASFSCVDAWRHSSGHWSAVSRPHRYFGYDIAKGANGTWYATGIFAD